MQSCLLWFIENLRTLLSKGKKKNPLRTLARQRFKPTPTSKRQNYRGECSCRGNLEVFLANFGSARLIFAVFPPVFLQAMSQYGGGLAVAGVYPEDEDDRLADLMGDSDYEDDEYIQSVSSPAC